MKKYIYLILCTLTTISVKSQMSDSLKGKPKLIREVKVRSFQHYHGTGYEEGVREGILLSGRKTEILFLDSIEACKALNTTRQIIGRIPGLTITETESGGFTANGIGTRGLNSIQSSEVQSRQNGYTLSADPFGYNESYYLPPMEAVRRIDFIRGAAGLQFGAQAGGVVLYEIQDPAADKKIQYTFSQTFGSYGLFNTYHTLGGRSGKFRFNSYLQYRSYAGFRPNSDQWQVSGFAKMGYAFSKNVDWSLEYSLLRNEIHMPGGLTDSLFDQNPYQSTRKRNWLTTPWNILSSKLEWTISEDSKLIWILSGQISRRSLVWRNEEGGPQALDQLDSLGAYSHREVGETRMKNVSSEIRFQQKWKMGTLQNQWVSGLRLAAYELERKGDGVGSKGSDFDLRTAGDFGYQYQFGTENLAAYAENSIQLTSRWILVPGVRFELINNRADGFKEFDGEKVNTNLSKQRSFVLGGLSSRYQISKSCQAYFSVSQAYRPVEYSQLTPIGVLSKVDPNMRDARSTTWELGFRGKIQEWLRFDLSGFILQYEDRIGITLETGSDGKTYTLRTNTGASLHQGVESYVELDILRLLHIKSGNSIRIYSSAAILDAHYTKGEWKGNRVEGSAELINRAGINGNFRKFHYNFQWQYQGNSFGDASNAVRSEEAAAGYIPDYQVIDISFGWQVGRYRLQGGINNALDKKYFTMRADEYPGPGIIPSVGRSFYLGIKFTL